MPDMDKDEVLRVITERNKIAQFAMDVLKCDERRAEAFVKVCGEYLKWDGTLQFKTASGSYIAADDPLCKGFFERNYEFLLPPKQAEQDVAQINPDTLARAVAGDLTAKGAVFRALHGDKPPSAESETLATVNSLLQAERTKTASDDEKEFAAFKQWKARSNGGNHETNPWNAAGNTTASGRYTDAAIAKQLSFTRTVGPEKAASTAAAVGARLGDIYAPGSERLALVRAGREKAAGVR